LYGSPPFTIPKLAVQELPPGVLPQDGGEELYATELYVYAGCTYDPEEIAVAKNHAMASPCENITLTAGMEQDFDVYQIPANVVWNSNYPDNVTVACKEDTGNTSCWLRGHRDIFDTHGVDEPKSYLTACVYNMCDPEWGNSCPSKLCAQIEAFSVVNLEGEWDFAGSTFGHFGLLLVQDGRRFTDAEGYIEHAYLSKRNVSFDIDDFHYEGAFYPDADHLAGYVWEIMTDTPVGSWSAERLHLTLPPLTSCGVVPFEDLSK
jgi:hypothetical protein